MVKKPSDPVNLPGNVVVDPRVPPIAEPTFLPKEALTAQEQVDNLQRSELPNPLEREIHPGVGPIAQRAQQPKRITIYSEFFGLNISKLLRKTRPTTGLKFESGRAFVTAEELEEIKADPQKYWGRMISDKPFGNVKEPVKVIKDK
jgi:hypothetical protein